MNPRSRRGKTRRLSLHTDVKVKSVAKPDSRVGTVHAEWAEASKSLRQATEYARGMSAMDGAQVREAVAQLINEYGIETLAALVGQFELNISRCRALGELLTQAHAQMLRGMSACGATIGDGTHNVPKPMAPTGNPLKSPFPAIGEK